MLGVSVSTVSRAVSTGVLTPVMRAGGGADGGGMIFRTADVRREAQRRKNLARYSASTVRRHREDPYA